MHAPLRSHALALGFLLLALLPPAAILADAETDQITGLEVAYLYNFTRFVEWPEDALGERFTLCVAGAPVLLSALRVLEGPRRHVAGRPITVRGLAEGDSPAGCLMLMVGEQAAARLPGLAEATAGQPVLIVGDGPDMAGRGAAIAFVVRRDILGEGRRLRFKIDRAALAGRGLEVSAQLFDVGEVLP